VTPYYERDGITIYCADAANGAVFVEASAESSVMVTDPPFGIGYESGHDGSLARSIKGDRDTTLRDAVLHMWGGQPAIVFGSWRAPRPERTRMVLVWDTGGALGMGDVTLPWKPSHQEIYVLGKGFSGPRTTDVLAYPPVQASAWRGRVHPHEKPVPLLRALIEKCPPGVIIDPFMGSGSTLRAAKDCGRRAVGIEIEPEYCEIAADRLRQAVLL
jgi:hypothetical protein